MVDKQVHDKLTFLPVHMDYQGEDCTLGTLPIQSSRQSSVQASVQICTQACSTTCILACGQACMYSIMQLSMQTKKDLGGRCGKEISLKFKCQFGFSHIQINILSIIKDNQFPLSYGEIAECLTDSFKITISVDAVRGIVQRLRNNKYINAMRSRQGSRRGNMYTLTSKVCEYIPILNGQMTRHFAIQSNIQTSVQSTMHDNTQSSVQAHSSIKIDRKEELSILNDERQRLENLSDADIAFFYPQLAKEGFRTTQIAQIIQRLEQQGISLENVMQGLTHAEWELEEGQMKNKQGELIKSPLNWVFQILAKQGYYPRPVNYISSEEQAELDKKQAELERQLALENAMKNATREKEDQEALAYQKWRNSLSTTEKEKIVGEKNKGTPSRFCMPEEIALKLYYKNLQEHGTS